MQPGVQVMQLIKSEAQNIVTGLKKEKKNQ